LGNSIYLILSLEASLREVIKENLKRV